MKLYPHLALMAALTGCGGGDDAGTTTADAALTALDAASLTHIDARSTNPVDAGPISTDETPIVTGVGAPTGAAVVLALDESGAVASEPTSGAGVRALPGTLGAAAEVTMQPVANLLPGGVGDGVSIAVASAQPLKQPVIVQLSYGAEVADPSQLLLAVQADDGSWEVLYPTRVDTVARTISAGLPLVAASAKPAGRAPAPVSVTSRTVVRYLGFYMEPASASVTTGKTLGLTPFARISQQTCENQPLVCMDVDDLCLLTRPTCSRPVINAVPFTNTKAGYIRTWYVDESLGGNATIGTVQPGGSVGATYTAPATKPDPDTVTVEFISVNQATGAVASAKAMVTIVGDDYLVSIVMPERGDLLGCGPFAMPINDSTTLTVRSGSSGELSVGDISNRRTSYQVPASPIPGCGLEPVGEAEWMTVSDGTAVVEGEEIAVDLDYTTVYMGCKVICAGVVAVLYPSVMVDAQLHFRIDTANFTDGTATAEDPVWKHKITITKLGETPQ